MQLNIMPIAEEGFGVEPSVADGYLVLRLTGTGDMAAVPPLRSVLVGAREELTRLGLKGVNIDIRVLYLLNSSCLKALVSFIYQLQTQGSIQPIKFIVDPRLSWQRRALVALERMAPDLVSIEDG
jgi:hypothetical protein